MAFQSAGALGRQGVAGGLPEPGGGPYIPGVARANDFYVCARRALRLSLRDGGDAFLDLPLPGGQTRRLPLVDVSVDGLSVVMDGEPLEPGSTFERAVLRIGETAVPGTVTVVHATPEFAIGFLCGARFEIPDAEDRRRFTEAVERLRTDPRSARDDR